MESPPYQHPQFFQTMRSRLQRRIQNSAKHLRWSVLRKQFIAFNGFQPLTIFPKHSLDALQGSEYAAALTYFSCFAVVLAFTPNTEFSLYSEVIHRSTTFKLPRLTKIKSSSSTSQFDIFLSFFFFFCYSNVAENKCHKQLCFLHESNQQHMCWCVRVQSHASNREN